MSNWKEYTLSELCEAIVDCEHKTAPLVNNSEFYSIRTTDIKNGKILFQDANRVSFETYQEWTRRLLPIENDIILAREAPVGEVGIIPKDLKVCLGQRTVLIRPKKEFSNPHYLLYLLASPNIKADLISQSAGSVVEHLNMKNIREFILPTLPPLPEQTAIAETLSSLDNKIDLLHRQNKTLEELAGTLFRQFIDSNSDNLSSLSLLDLIELVGGGTPQTEKLNYWDGEIKWISAKDITSNHKQFITSTEKAITEEGLKNSSTKKIPKFCTVISARGTVGKYCLLSEDMAFSQSNYGIKPKIPGCYFFTYLLIASCIDEFQSAAYGTVFDTITTTTFKEQIVGVPNQSKIIDFENSIKPYFSKLLANTIQIQTLQKLRDTLLPKLMSGEVRVKLN
jgi:type I restriction enzyme S subunit